MYTLYFDGASKGNPGVSGAGAVIYKDDEEVLSTSIFVGEKHTNNQAEYLGLIIGLLKALDLNVKTLMIKGDSKLVLNQVSGKWQVKSENLKNLAKQSRSLINLLIM